MGKIDILDKLRIKFQSVPNTEEDIVFILSRVRKVLDKDNHGLESQFGILRFYCNLALHTDIDKVPKEFGVELRRVHDRQAPYHPLYGYNDLHAQMQSFMQEYELPNFYENPAFSGGNRFTELLNSIYSDTPITVQAVQKYRIIINPDGTIASSASNE